MEEESLTFVLSIPAVRTAIALLKSRDTHPFFIAYLWLRRQSALQSTTTEIEPNWVDLGPYLRVADAPTNKPFLRPFWKGARSEGREWLNSNLAGSFAPSSLREAPREVIDTTAAGFFVLRPDHCSLALEKLLSGERMEVLPLSLFLFRDFGFVAEEVPTVEDLVNSFKAEFGFSDADQGEFETIFAQDFDPRSLENIFELYRGDS